MTDETKALLRVVIQQVAALKEHATALGMQAETLDRTVQAALAAEPPLPLSATPSRTGPTPVKYFGPGIQAPQPPPTPPEGASTK